MDDFTCRGLWHLTLSVFSVSPVGCGYPKHWFIFPYVTYSGQKPGFELKGLALIRQFRFGKRSKEVILKFTPKI